MPPNIQKLVSKYHVQLIEIWKKLNYCILSKDETISHLETPFVNTLKSDISNSIFFNWDNNKIVLYVEADAVVVDDDGGVEKLSVFVVLFHT